MAGWSPNRRTVVLCSLGMFLPNSAQKTGAFNSTSDAKIGKSLEKRSDMCQKSFSTCTKRRFDVIFGIETALSESGLDCSCESIPQTALMCAAIL